MDDAYVKVSEAHKLISDLSGDFVPELAIILGTGLGDFADRVDQKFSIPYNIIPHFCVSTVEGHKGQLILGNVSGKPAVVMQGRLHFYEGYSLEQVTFPVRVLRSLGAQILIVNSAAGGLRPGLQAGNVMLVTDHINLMGVSPLRGVNDSRLGERFPDMSRVYDAQASKIALEAASTLGIEISRGVYAAVSGPNLETPAETRMLRMIGADAVGMSSVPEIIVAAQVGFRILFLVAITNVNDPDDMKPVSIDSVISNAKLAGHTLNQILENTIARIVC